MRRRRKKVPSEKRAKPRAEKTLIRFYVLFGLCALGVALFSPVLFRMWKVPMTRLVYFTSTLIGGFLNLFGAQTEVNGVFVNMNDFSLQVIHPCIGTMELLYFSAAVLAFPSDYKKKLWGILLFIPLIYLLNILRTSLLVVAGNSSMDLFNLAHTYFLQISQILTVAIFWLFWIKKVVGYERKPVKISG